MAFRTKKISQMDPKGSNLASTDLLEISELVSGSYVTKSITGAEIIASVPPTTVDWGDIGGTLSAQTDLNTALSGKVPTTRTLTINGTTQDLSADRTFTISTGITIGTTAITSGTVGRVLFEGTGNVVQESAGLTYNDTTKTFTLSGNQNASTSLIISNTTSGSTAQSALLLNSTAGIYKYSASTTPYKIFASNDFGHYNGIIGDISILNDVANGKIKFATNQSNTPQMTLAATGNVLINTTTDAGFKLDVNGTAIVRDTLSISNQGRISWGGGFLNIFADSSNGLSLHTPFGRVLSCTQTTGNVLIGTTTDVASSLLTMQSTTKGFLPPRMTTTQKNAIASPATGLMVYDTTLNLISVYNGTTWISL
jgi:hypothetical protein